MCKPRILEPAGDWEGEAGLVHSVPTRLPGLLTKVYCARRLQCRSRRGSKRYARPNLRNGVVQGKA